MQNGKLMQQKIHTQEREELIMKKICHWIGNLFKRLDIWSQKNVFVSGVIISMTASLILTLLGYLFAIKPVNDNLTGISADISNISNDLSQALNSIQIVQNQISTTQSQISQIQTNFNEHTTLIANLQNDLNINIENTQKQFNELKNNIENNVNFYILNPDILSLLQSTFSTDQSVFSSSGIHQFDNQSDKVLTNLATGEVYTVADLHDETIVIHYVENGEDVFFKGQYDKNGYWDGNCIINRYQNGILTMIMDAVYESGILISYEQLFTYSKSSENNVWAIAVREVYGNSKSGYTWTYYKEKDYSQDFNTELVNSNDILNIKEFKARVELLPEGYYSGYTSNGFYNDDTGNAYLIKYYNDGTIQMIYKGDFRDGQPYDHTGNAYMITFFTDATVDMLYVGNFIDGKPNDTTGNAWYIKLGYDNINYYYYKGIFKNGGPTGDDQIKYSISEIENLISDMDFGYELNWRISD